MPRPASNMGLFFHKLSKDISMGGRVRIPKDQKDYPKSWVEVDYKTYEDRDKIRLLDKEECSLDGKLTDVVLDRTSAYTFDGSSRGMTIKDLSAIINFSIAIKDKNTNSVKRVHPSGGARYSLEHYFLVQHSNELKKGIYHYNVKEHCLEFLLELDEIPKVSKYPFVSDASVVMFMTSIFDRNMRKYGERGYRYILLEAGHVGQNVYLVCTALGLPVRAVAGTRDEIIESLLGVDGEQESLVYTVVI
jgi:SagB-type dehydrogenase family enzyme